MSRVYNFSAGPAVLPVEVLQEEEDRLGTHFRDAERQSDEPLQYLGGNESALRKCRRGRAEVLSAQSAAPVRVGVLPAREGRGAPGRHLGPREH